MTAAAQEKRYYMACLDLEGRDVLVVGAGSVALEKIEGLLEVGARVTVVAPAVSEPVQALARAGRIALHRGVYRAQDLDGRFLVVAATSTTSVNEQVYADADARGMLCNVVDVPELCSFILPAVHRADPIAVAISTGGASPALAQRIRDDVARSITHEHARLARELRELRPWAKSHLPTYEARRDFFRELVRGAPRMTVTLVGAGPGDPGLITVRGLERLRACDAVVYDRLVAPELVDEAPADALRIARENLSQAEVDELLVRLGREGLDVVRLKGGDPYVFGRGGEEAIALIEADIPVEVVPGISSVAAVPAAAGIPVTHRGVSDRVTIATGHAADGSPPDYDALAAAEGTLVLFMGLARLRELADGLVRAGRSPDTPAAVVSRGTLPDQEVATATLDTIADAAAGLPGPALVVVGDVVGLAPRLRRRSPAALLA